MKIIAKNNNVILKQRSDLEQKQFGNIIVPQGDDKSFIGEIISVGSGYYLSNGDFIKLESKIGDIVVYPNFGSTKFKIEGKEYIVTKEQDLIAKLEL
ncbi:MAG TPA: co-chaperone GroES family protein [Nitrososphaeraceae archaeon]|nr:co-chaperone GroES family protein [Nitrososphaeraceae archaeon]